MPKTLHVENILAENGEMQRVKDNIWEMGDMEGQRGLIKIQIKDSVVQFTNSVHSK